MKKTLIISGLAHLGLVILLCYGFVIPHKYNDPKKPQAIMVTVPLRQSKIKPNPKNTHNNQFLEQRQKISIKKPVRPKLVKRKNIKPIQKAKSKATKLVSNKKIIHTYENTPPNSSTSRIPDQKISGIITHSKDTGKRLDKAKKASDNTTVHFNPNAYNARIKEKIAAQKIYPTAAKRRNIQGRVMLQLSVNKNGSIKSLKIIRSSGSNILDQSALNTVYRSALFDPIPKIISFNVALNYALY
ncbi:MAG: protein TonB [Alphaproteobacteria bacterium]|jgi:protein TonB